MAMIVFILSSKFAIHVGIQFLNTLAIMYLKTIAIKPLKNIGD